MPPLPSSVPAHRAFGPAHQLIAAPPKHAGAPASIPFRHWGRTPNYLVPVKHEGTRPAGQVAWAPSAAVYYTFAVDSAGNTIKLDANGRPLHGSVTDPNNQPVADERWTGVVTTVGGQPLAFYAGGAPVTPVVPIGAATAPKVASLPWIQTPSGQTIVGGALVLGVIGLIVYAAGSSKSTTSAAPSAAPSAVRANPARRRRSHRSRR